MSEKAEIVRVGTFLPDGQPTGWSFKFTGSGAGVRLERGKPTLYGGYTLEELHEIKRRAETEARP